MHKIQQNYFLFPFFIELLRHVAMFLPILINIKHVAHHPSAPRYIKKCKPYLTCGITIV